MAEKLSKEQMADHVKRGQAAVKKLKARQESRKKPPFQDYLKRRGHGVRIKSRPKSRTKRR